MRVIRPRIVTASPAGPETHGALSIPAWHAGCVGKGSMNTRSIFDATAMATAVLLGGCANSGAVHGTGGAAASSSHGATTGTSSAGTGGAGTGGAGTGGAGTSSAGTGGGAVGSTSAATTTATSGSASSSSSSTGGGSPCAGKIGQYCGASLGLDAATLYSCNDDMPMVSKTCSAGCVTHGTGADACACPSGDGLYCGQVVGGDATTLYNCNGGVLTVDAKCVGACQVKPAGQSDTCGTCPSGNGLYCGSGIGMDASTLFNCNGGVLSVAQQCPSPCHVNPPGQSDTCGSCPSGNGAYCGATLGMDPNKLYDCNNGNLTVTQACPSTCHVAPAGQSDYCTGNGQLSCSSLQWWNTALTYGPYQLQNGGQTWWDTDLAVGAGTPIQLRHDSKLVQAPVQAWGWQPRFLDMATGDTFQLLHMKPQAQYTTALGTVYPAGTIVGLSGGDTGDTGYPTYSTGSHLCVETLATWQSAFPQGNDACH